MGNREDLLAGARRVIEERGVAKATARDIATEAGVSLAAIGYHFGSKEQLITAALVDTLDTAIGDSMGALIREGGGLPLVDAFAHLWDGMPAVYAAHRGALLASLENVLRIARDPDDEGQMRGAVDGAFADIAEEFASAHPDLDEQQARALAELSLAMVQGLSLIWLLNPEGTPSGERIAEAVQLLGGR